MDEVHQESVTDVRERATGDDEPRPAPDAGTVVLDAAGRVISADPVAERLLDRSVDQFGALSGSRRWVAVDSEGRHLGTDQLPSARVLRTGEPVRDAVLGIRSHGEDGPLVWLRVDAEPLFRDGSGTPRGVSARISPVGDLQALALSLRESERRYRLLAESSSDMVSLLAPDGTYLWASPACERLLGYPPDTVIGTPARDHVHPEDLPAVRIARAHLLAGRDGGTAAIRFRHADGHYLWAEITGRAVFDDDGEPVHAQLVMREITQQVDAERARDDVAAELATIMDHAPVGMVVVDAEGRWVQVNHAVCAMLGRPAEALRRRSLLEWTHPDDHELSLAIVDRLRSGGADTITAEKRYVRLDGEVIWVLLTASRIPGRPVAHGGGAFVAQLLDITDRKRAERALEEMALTDALTGLPNRALLMDRLRHALASASRTGTRVGVIFLDLDWFKQVNDRLGHDGGDELLRQVAARMSSALRGQDTAVRLGGDEFVVVCEEVEDPSQVAELAQRLRTVIEEPYLIGEQQVVVSASFGIAVGDDVHAEDLLAQADASMYRVKRNGKAGVDVFDEVAQRTASDRLSLQRELGAAITQDQLVLFYQPIVDLRDGRVVSREALVRWRHPARGLITPDNFLEAAEQSHLIFQLTAWVLHAACRQAAAWTDGALVAVNISARDLSLPDFPDTVAGALAAAGLEPSRLCLELTESYALQHSRTTFDVARRLREVGVNLSLDDFGTGQSSITVLHRLSVDRIKIDRSFVADLPGDEHSASLVDGLVRLGTSLGLDVIAEGIETVEQAHWLTDHGCPHGQGFLYGRPVEQG